MVKAISVGVLVMAGCASPPPPVSQVDPLPQPAPVTQAAAPSTSTAVAAAEPAPTTEAPAAEEAAPVTALGSCGLVATIVKKGDDSGYKLTLENRGKQTLSLVVPGDGSESGWRTPALSWSGTIGGKVAKPHDQSRCGMMNPIEKNEIFSLAPGAKKTMETWIYGPPFDAGTYELKLKYRNDPSLIARKSASQGEVATLLAHSSACEVTSAPITVKIR